MFVHKKIKTEMKKRYKKFGCRAIFRTMSDIYDGALISKNITATAVKYFLKKRSVMGV